MKLLVFAHVPPPHHGQSYMVKMMLDHFGGDCRDASPAEYAGKPRPIECYHVDCRYSDNLEDIGSFRFGKAWLVLRYCLEAIWCRFRHGVTAFYYVPAPGKRAALYRDWIVMLLCRPFFQQFVHHWHAVGLGDWLRAEGSAFERWLTHHLLGKPALGLSLAVPSMRDALWFETERVELVPNGIPDPCPDFDETVQPHRQARLRARAALLAGEPGGAEASRFRVLYLAHCTREKGLFDTLDAIALANAQLEQNRSPLRMTLTVAGLFPSEEEESEYLRRVAMPDLAGAIEYAGFVAGAEKSRLLAECDCLCFPSYYHAESFGLVVVEAMAAGMAVVTTRWRAIPELLPPDYVGFVPQRDPAAIAEMLQQQFVVDDAERLRAHFLANFTEDRHVQFLTAALQRVEEIKAV